MWKEVCRVKDSERDITQLQHLCLIFYFPSGPIFQLPLYCSSDTALEKSIYCVQWFTRHLYRKVVEKKRISILLLFPGIIVTLS